MGNIFGKPGYPVFDESTKTKLNKLFEEVITKVSIDYASEEIQDIQTAVQSLLQRIVDRVNERGMFKICRIQPCGSMAERTALWKYDACAEDVYIERLPCGS